MIAFHTRYTRPNAPGTRVLVMSPAMTGTASPPALARSWSSIGWERSMPCTSTPRRARSGSATRPVPIASSSAGPSPASAASRSTTGSSTSAANIDAEVASYTSATSAPHRTVPMASAFQRRRTTGVPSSRPTSIRTFRDAAVTLVAVADAADRSDALLGALREHLARVGTIGFDEYVGHALYTPRLGFYTSGRGAGRRRDFLTSAEVGPLFGAVVARALDTWWDELGRPDPYVVVEAGAGPGTLARSVLAAAPRCAAALRLVLVDPGEAQWATHPAGVESRAVLPASGELGDDPVVVLANELLDNLPFALVTKTGAGAWSEVRVAWDDATSTLGEVLVRLDGARTRWCEDRAGADAPVGARVPVQADAASWLVDALALAARGGGWWRSTTHPTPPRWHVGRGTSGCGPTPRTAGPAIHSRRPAAATSPVRSPSTSWRSSAAPTPIGTRPPSYGPTASTSSSRRAPPAGAPRAHPLARRHRGPQPRPRGRGPHRPRRPRRLPRPRVGDLTIPSGCRQRARCLRVDLEVVVHGDVQDRPRPRRSRLHGSGAADRSAVLSTETADGLDRRAGGARAQWARGPGAVLRQAGWMRFIVYGAGAIGGVIGWNLQDAGHEVVFVARGPHLAAMQADGLRLAWPDGSGTLPVTAVATPPRSSGVTATS